MVRRIDEAGGGGSPDPANPTRSLRIGPWRAWQTFQASLAGAFLAFLAFLGVSLLLHQRHGELTGAESAALLRLLYWGTYPLVFVALGALAWHLVRFYRGDYARR